MRCECCDRILSDEEATSKFVESGTYTNMCTGCLGFLPKEIKVATRQEKPEEKDVDFYDYEGDQDGQENFEE
jgi:hypothetical protein